MQPHLLRALPVLEADRVGVACAVLHPVAERAALARLGLDARLRGIARQGPGRHVGGVVDAARDDGIVRVAVQEIHDHFLPDARDRDRPEPRARPARRHAHPAAGVLVHRPQPVPVELHLDAAVFVRPDFLACRAYDHCRLWACGAWLGCFSGGGVGQARGLGREAEFLERALLLVVLERLARLGAVERGTARILVQVVGDARDEVLPVLVAARVVLQGKGVARREAAAARFTPDGAVSGQAFLQAHPGVLLAVAMLHVAARPFVDL
ncbi:hypothetical protein COLO4_01559, partial [Corchorus olitorius]